MPVLPTKDINVQAVDLQQGPSMSRATMVWDAVGNVGKQIAGFSEQLAQKRYEADKKSFISSSSNDLARFVSEKETELKAKYTGDPTGMAEEMNQSLKDWHEQRRELAPNADAKDEWELRFGEASNNIGQRIDSMESKQRVDFQVGRMKDDVFKNAQSLASKPSTENAAHFLNNTAEMVNDGVGLWYADETEAKKAMQDFGSQHTKALMEGFEANKQYGQALNVFSGKDPNSKIILSHMPADQIGAYKDRFNKLQKAENEFSKSMFNLEAGDVSTALQMGKPIDDSVVQSMIQKSSMLKPEERKVFLDDLQNDVGYGKVLQQMKNVPLEDIQQMKGYQPKRDPNDIFNLRSRMEKQERFQKMANDMIDKRVNNAPQYHYENDNSIRSLVEQARNPEDTNAINAMTKALVSKQNTDGTADIKIFNESLSKDYADMLKSPNPQMAEKAYSALKDGMSVGNRNYARNAIADMVRFKHLEPVQGMALSLDNPESRKNALVAISKKTEIESMYQKVKSAEDGAENPNDVLNDPKVNEFKNAIISANPDAIENATVLNGFSDLMVLQYKSARANGKSIKEAKSLAVSNILKDNFSVVKGGNSQMILGNEFKQHASNVQTFLKESLNPHYLETLGVKHPAIYDQTMGALGKADSAKARYLYDLSKSGEWVMNSSQNGATLYKKQGKQRVPVLDEKGNKISMPFDKMKPIDSKLKNKFVGNT